MTFSTFGRLAIYLLSLNFSAENMGGFTQEFNDFMAVFLLLLFLLLYLPFKSGKTDTSLIVKSILFIPISIWTFRQGGVFKLISEALCVFALHGFLLARKRSAPELRSAFWTTIIYSIFIICYNYLSSFWFAAQWISHYVSKSAGILLPFQVDCGSTYTGLKITLIFAIFFATTALSSRDAKKYIAVLGAVFIFLLTNILYVVFQSYLFKKLGYQTKSFAGGISLHSHVFLFLFLSAILYLYLRRKPIKEGIPMMTPGWMLSFFIIGALPFLFWLGFAHHDAQKNHPCKIVFFDEGFLDWNVPVFGRYGGRSGGMFGVLIHELRARNYEVKIGGISEESLFDAKALVLINLKRSLTKDEKRLVLNFVQRGGALLVLGDHTGLTHIRKPYNDLLSPVNISFNFDSAMSLMPKWVNGFEVRPHFITTEIKDENDLQIWIGASLTISHPARPVIVGKYAYSDLGNIRAVHTGYLGNMQYSQGEKLGNLVLVAESSYGKGKVLVFGDTSSFQNSALALSSPFVERVFLWLCTRDHVFHAHNRLLLTVLLLFSVSLLAVERVYIRAAMIPLLGLGTIFYVALGIHKPVRDLDKREVEARLAYVDISHLERINRDLWGEPDGFGGLNYNLIRNGYSPLVLKGFDLQRVQDAELLVIIAPAKPFTEQEIEAIGKFVRLGGHLILTVGWEERDASRNLLAHFQLDIGNIPLGNVSPEQNAEGITFHKAWPVIYDEEEGISLCEIWNYPAIVYREYGKGGVLVVGDSSFLLNRNLEGLHNYSKRNIMFLKKVIETKFRSDGALP